jgi:hypothetical protein
MANRSSTFLIKRSNVVNKIPAISGLTLGELALNTADAKLYTLYTGGAVSPTEVRQIGWDRLSISGGTIFGNILVNGSVSATTFYGDGSQLTGIVSTDNYVTGGTFNSSTNTLYLYRQNGEVVITGFTSSGGVITPSSCNISNTTTNDFEQKLVGSITGFTSGSYIVKSYITTYSGTSKYGFWERTLGVVTSGDTPIVTIVTQDFDDYYSNISLVPTQVSYVPAINNSIEIYVSGVTSENLYWSSYYEILGQNCGSSVSSGSGPFTGNTSADCISNIFVSNIHSCSPLNINPNNEGNINIGLNNDVVIDLSGNSTKLIVDGSISATTFYGSGLGLTNIPFSGVTDLSGQLDLKTDLTLFGSHTGNTSNPHQTSFSQLTSTAHTHTISDINDLTNQLSSKFSNSGGTVNGNVIINGNVQILGSATTINTQTLSIADNVVTLNSNYSGNTAPFFGHSGIEVLRGSGTTAAMLWEEQNSQWEAGLHGSTKRIILQGDSLALLTSGHTHPISEINDLQSSLDSKFNTSGGTITNNVTVLGSVSATTFYGNGQYLTGLVTNDFYVTGGTFSGTTLTLNRQNGSVTITGFTSSSGGGTFTGGTVAGATNFTGGLTANTINTPITNTQVVYSNSGTLTGSTNLTWVNSAATLTINGTLEATSKSFSIPHPTKEGKKLVYGSLEGPENGVYHRGKLYNYQNTGLS